MGYKSSLERDHVMALEFRSGRGRDCLAAVIAERMDQSIGDLQANLFHARFTVNQVRTDLSRTVDVSNANDLTAATSAMTVTNAANALADLDEVISCIHQRLKARTRLQSL